MRKFDKLVAVEPVNMLPADEARLGAYAREVVVHRDIPQSADEAVRRIGGADAVLVSSTTRLTADILGRCPGLRYVGMCCSLYSPESANVDIRYAAGRGITVTGIRDYGDEGVVEYVVSELVRCLHGYGQEPWLGAPSEITGLKAGFVGLGASGGMIARALAGFGADVLAHEPPRRDNPLLHAPNTIITPHMAWTSRTARQRLLTLSGEIVRRWMQGTPVNLLNRVKAVPREI